jgi:hypothetical protein
MVDVDGELCEGNSLHYRNQEHKLHVIQVFTAVHLPYIPLYMSISPVNLTSQC